jgi:inner membrane protein
MLRLLSVAFLALLLQIPISMIGSLVKERQDRHGEAVEEVSSKWGKTQSITGPALVVPYTIRWNELGPNGQQIPHTASWHATFLAEKLEVHGRMDSEVRSRGIFSVPVFKLSLTMAGDFRRPDLSELRVESPVVAWNHAQLALGISDARAIQEQTSVSWNGREIGFLPGTGDFQEVGTGIHAIVGVGPGDDRLAFSFPLTLNGSLGFYMVPFGRSTIVNLESDWRSPSFQGNWLPSNRSLSDRGFSASWTIPFLGRNYPQAWTSQTDMRNSIDASHFGLQLVDPVDYYHMAERSVKYAGLFILLTFSAVWLTEVLAGLRVHPIQYLLVGAALCLFYLLELSLSEHLGFSGAYALASCSVVGMVAAYSFAILQRAIRAAVIGGVIAALYAYLYVLLQNEDFALVVGSIGLFVTLAVVMLVTRRVDWYSIGSRRSPASNAS